MLDINDERAPRRGNAHGASWTRELVMERIAKWAEQHGQPPSAAQWNPARARTMAEKANTKARSWLDGIAAFEDGDWPSQDTVERLFGSWNAGIEAAGFAKRPVGRTPAAFAARHRYDAHAPAMRDLRVAFAAVDAARSEGAVRRAVAEVASIALAWLEHIDTPIRERAA